VVYIAYLKEHNFHFQSPCITSVIIYHPETGKWISLTLVGSRKQQNIHMMGNIRNLSFISSDAMDEFLMMPLCYRWEKERLSRIINKFGGTSRATCGADLVTVKERHKFSHPR
jgi:hypothetical protein